MGLADGCPVESREREAVAPSLVLADSGLREAACEQMQTGVNGYTVTLISSSAATCYYSRLAISSAVSIVSCCASTSSPTASATEPRFSMMLASAAAFSCNVMRSSPARGTLEDQESCMGEYMRML